MTSRNRRNTLWALALGLVMAGAGARDAHANPIPFGTIGTVSTPSGGIPGLVSLTGNAGTFDTSTSPAPISLGSFVVSPLAMQSGTPNQTYTNDPFQMILYSGPSASVKLDGLINGMVGPTVTNPSLTATFTSVSPYSGNPMPFNTAIPLNTPLSLSLPTGSSPGTTTITVAASTVPEPTSVAVFAIAVGGLGLWNRRRLSTAL
jgi:hypothetical protein